MNEVLKPSDSCHCSIGWVGKTQENNQAPRTHWDFKLYKDRAAFEAGKVMEAWECDNLVTNEGKDALNNIMFHAATQITAWHVLIFNTNTTPAATMTYASPGFTESTDYDELTRPEYVESASSGQSITNTSSRALFTMNASTTIYGCALVGGGSAASTKTDTAGGGTLYCVSLFSSAKTVVAENVVSVGITITQS